MLDLGTTFLQSVERSPQALALRSALALCPGAATDRFIIGAATLSVLAAHAEESPLLVLVGWASMRLGGRQTRSRAVAGTSTNQRAERRGGLQNRAGGRAAGRGRPETAWRRSAP